MSLPESWAFFPKNHLISVAGGNATPSPSPLQVRTPMKATYEAVKAQPVCNWYFVELLAAIKALDKKLQQDGKLGNHASQTKLLLANKNCSSMNQKLQSLVKSLVVWRLGKRMRWLQTSAHLRAVLSFSYLYWKLLFQFVTSHTYAMWTYFPTKPRMLRKTGDKHIYEVEVAS